MLPRKMRFDDGGILSDPRVGIPAFRTHANIFRIALGAIVSRRRVGIVISSMAAILLIGLCAQMAIAQVRYSPEELDQLVARIALYPDPLLAQIITAATYPDQIPDAAAWADQHHYLTGE